MSIQGEWVSYGSEQEFTGYRAYPERARSGLPAILVLQEIWGVDEHIQDVTRRFAAAGYVAFAPDLYAKSGLRPSGLESDRVEEVKGFLNSVPPAIWHSPEAREEALHALPSYQEIRIRESLGILFGGMQLDRYIGQLQDTLYYLREEDVVTRGKGIASIGFCMGGGLSARLACVDPQLKGAAIFYGSAPAPELLEQIECKVIGFYGGLDARITDAVPAFSEAMQQQGKSFEFHIYEGAEHAFFNDGRSSYQAEASRDAFAKTLTFFNEVLK